jgi:polysaccharide export outer membrane protein
MNLRILLLLGLAALVVGGCAHAPAPKPVPAALVPVPEARGAIDAAWLQPSTAAYTLGPGDRLAIHVEGETDTRVETVVGPDGKVYYEMLSGIDVWGQTLGQARTALETALKQYYRDEPRVNLSLLEVGSKHVWLLGRVGAPGLYPLTGPTTLLDAISAAGGPAAAQTVSQLGNGASVSFTNPRQNAGDLKQAFVVRNGQPLPVNVERLLKEGDMTQNIYLQPDDLVYLPSPRAQEVYVLGAVAQARAVRLPGQATLVGAIAAAGGTVEYAYLTQVAVVRGGVSEPTIAVYDYKAIVTGLAPNVALEPNDIVYVPRTPYHVLSRYLDIIFTAFVRTVGVNAGARAANVERDITISVPIAQ